MKAAPRVLPAILLSVFCLQAEVREVIVVSKTHFDIGFTDMASKVVENYRTGMIDKALAVVEESRAMPPEQRFVWTVPGWPMSQVVWSGQEPGRRERVLAAYREGRFVTHALPFTTHTESLELEDVVRGMGFASRLARGAMLPLPRDAKMTDVPSHAWALPTILAHAGVEFLHVGCNSAVASPEVPKLFWWVGPDGSRVLTMYEASGYGSDLKAPEGWPYSTWLALIHTGDNHGPPTAAEVRAIFERAARELPGVRVRMGRLSDFADAIRKENPSLPVVNADMPDTWIHGTGSQPVATGWARNARPRIAAAEMLGTLLELWGAGKASPERIAEAYEQSLLYGEHTWGIDAKRFPPPLYGEEWERARAGGKYQRLEASWAEHAGYADKARDISGALLGEEMTALARAVNVPGRRIVVFNPLPWARSGIVEANGVRFLARDIPAGGYRAYTPAEASAAAPDPLRASGDTIENAALKITLDAERCAIASILDKRTGRELVEPGFGEYVHERFGPRQIDAYTDAYLKTRPDWAIQDVGRPGLPADTRYDRTTPGRATLTVSRSPVSITATLEAAGSGLRVTLETAQPHADIEWFIRDKRPDRAPEAGWLVLPLRVPRPQFRVGRLGVVADPATFVRGSNHDLFAVNTGVMITGTDGCGAAVCPLDSPLVSLGRSGAWKYSREFTAEDPTVLVSLYNNQFSTNFALWSGGALASRVRVWPVESADNAAGLVVPAAEARSPLLAAVFDGPAGSLPRARAGVAVSRPGTLVTAFGANPDAAGLLLLRLWEQSGASGECTVRLPEGMKTSSLTAVDLRGRVAGRPIPVRNGAFTFNAAKYAPLSLTAPVTAGRK